MYSQPKLYELIQFARVDAGSIVIDVYPGDGDWMRLFSGVVGPQGRVYSFVPAEIARLKNDSVETLISTELVAIPAATRPADVLWLHLFYHDLHTALIQTRGPRPLTSTRFLRRRLTRKALYAMLESLPAVAIKICQM